MSRALLALGSNQGDRFAYRNADIAWFGPEPDWDPCWMHDGPC